MSTKTTLRKPAFLLPLIIAFVITIVLGFLTQSTRGKEVYADVWLDELFLFFSLCLCVVLIFSQWKTASKGRKYLLLSITGLSILLIINGTSRNWQYFPWGRASAFDTADKFMTDLQEQDSTAAFEILSPIVQKHISANDLSFPDARPISWQLNDIDRRSIITGSATFSDGVQLPIELRLNWINNQWKIYGVGFGETDNLLSNDPETMPRMYFMYCCDNSGIVDSVFSLINGKEDFGYNFSR